MSLEIMPVRSKKEKREFYRFPFRVYRDDPNWVPHLWPQRQAYLNRTAAFFEYGEGDFWLARRGGETVGTIGVAVDHSRNRERHESAAIFGFFEVLEEYPIAAALWDHACAWGRKRGFEQLLGPYSFASNDESGFLVEGYDTFPSVLMGHNAPWYGRYAEQYGFTRLHDGLAYRYDVPDGARVEELAPAALRRIAARAIARHGPGLIRNPRMQDWDDEVVRLHAVYNRSLAVLPEFSPIELVEFRTMAASLREIIDPELVFIAQVEGETAGFALGLPNISEALRYANGLQKPWDYIRLLIARRKIRGASLKILAIDPKYWGYGIEALFFLRMAEAIVGKGYTWVDGSLTGEGNPQTNKIAARFGASVYRRYREYQISL